MEARFTVFGAIEGDNRLTGGIMAPIYLTKSRFVSATECARKLNYALDSRYPDAMEDDEFLKALADGGHQVGHLARLLYAGGTLVTGTTREAQAQQTQKMLSLPDATIYEGTVIYGRLLVRCDILVKRGNTVRLIEVKSKSCDASSTFVQGKSDALKIRTGWESYLYDLTYQAYVFELAFPGLTIIPCLLLVDKEVRSSVDGLSAAFQIASEGRNVTVSVDPAFDPAALVPSILREFEVSREVALLRKRPLSVLGSAHNFDEFVARLSDSLDKPAADAATALPKNISAACKGCEFYSEPAESTEHRRSGWHQCMSEHYQGAVTVSRRDTFFGVYWPARGQIDKFLAAQALPLSQIPEAAFPVKGDTQRTVDNAKRQHLQWEEHQGNTKPYILLEAIQEEIAGWKWPLHFIDFETAAPALPYTRGRRPYEQVLFQFSHHVLHEDGRLVHQSQHLEAAPGVAASVPTLRKLNTVLSADNGTVLHWWDHERTILRAIREQLLEDSPPDMPSLLGFLEALVGARQSTDGDRNACEPEAAVQLRLVDFGRLISRTAFYPGTGGSSSIKKVLAAVLRITERLRDRYGAAVYGTSEIPSHNFTDPAGFRWVVMDGTCPRDPYSLLNPLVVESGIDASAIEDRADGSEFVANGGAAMMAYDRLQRPGLGNTERSRLVTQLLRYCELDTLAMVMVFQSLTLIGL